MTTARLPFRHPGLSGVPLRPRRPAKEQKLAVEKNLMTKMGESSMLTH